MVIKLLAHDVRWRIVLALTRSDRRGQELAQLLKRPQNLVSYHLQRLLHHKLISERRSAADGRDIYFSLRHDELRRRYEDSGHALHLDTGDARSTAELEPAAAAQAPSRVLFLCTHNSARSQMAEAILRHLSKGQIDVHSAGNEPAAIHPLAIQAMRARSIKFDGHRSKYLSEFIGQGFDFIVTVCDRAREACPVFPGDPEQIHWSFPDPTAVTGVDACERAFDRTATELTTRINYLLLIIQRQRQEGPKS